LRKITIIIIDIEMYPYQVGKLSISDPR